jgi:hypothetical protein
MREKALFVQIFAIVIFILYNNSFPQDPPIETGSKIISGNFSFSSAGGELNDNNDGDRLFTIEFDPAVNFFISPGLAIGGKLLFSRSSQGAENSTTWGVGPEIIYFFGSANDHPQSKGSTYPFIQAGYYYTSSVHNIKGFIDNINISQIETKFRLGAGVAHMISNAVAINILAAYEIDSNKIKDHEELPDSGNQYGIYAGFLIFLY